MPNKEDKRRPTLADTFLANQHPFLGQLVGKPMLDKLKRRVREARKFIFDEDASERVANVVHTIPELILRESQFAMAPFDVTWIEYQSRPYWRVMMDQWQPDEYADNRVGFLIDHNRVNVFAEGGDAKRFGGNGVYPIAYHLNTEWPVEDQLRFAEIMRTSRLGIDVWFWGSSAQKFLDSGEARELRVLRDHNMAEWLGDPKWLERSHVVTDFLKGANGDLRTVIAFLLMLNRPSIVQYRKTLPNWRGFIGNKVRPYMSHTVVHVSLDAVPTLRLIGTPAGDAIARRRHEVRGHFCHDKVARDFMRIAGCIHDWRVAHEDWTPWPDAPLGGRRHWICGVCEGKRWRRDKHERGTAEVGFVAHDGYEVSP